MSAEDKALVSRWFEEAFDQLGMMQQLGPQA